jgi:hypothetical protein
LIRAYLKFDKTLALTPISPSKYPVWRLSGFPESRSKTQIASFRVEETPEWTVPGSNAESEGQSYPKMIGHVAVPCDAFRRAVGRIPSGANHSEGAI